MQTAPGDILLVHHQGKPVSYARVEEISADIKPGWWQLSLLLLTVPTQAVTWILREEYIDGGDFTMGGASMRLDRLPPPQAQQEPPPPEPDSAPEQGGGAKVLSLARRKPGR